MLSASQDSPAAWSLLSEIFVRLGRLDDAISFGQKAVAIADQLSPAQGAGAISNLGTLYSLCGRHEQALACFRTAAQREPRNGEFLYNLATAQRALGDLAAAEDACTQAIAVNPDDCQAHYLRSDLRTQTAERNHVGELRALLGRRIPDPEQRTLVHYALGKECEDLQQFEAAFEQFKAGADLYRSTLRYEVATDIEAIARIIATHTRTALAGTSPGFGAAAPIFVVGLPRSGTTLVERILASHSDVTSVGERNDFALQMTQRVRTAMGNAAASRKEMIERSLQIDMAALGQGYWDRVKSDELPRQRPLDKMPINYLYCGLIHRALPRARIISVRRDAMDSCYSAFKAFLRGPYAFTYNLGELGQYYLAYDRLVGHWRHTLPPDAYMEVHYEDVVANAAGEARRMLDFLGLAWEPQVLEFHRSGGSSSTASAAQVRQPIYASSVGKWRRYEAQLAPLRQLLEPTITRNDRERSS